MKGLMLEPMSLFEIDGKEVVLPLGGAINDFVWFKFRTDSGWSVLYRRLFLLEDVSKPLGALNETKRHEVLTPEVSRVRPDPRGDA